MAVRPKGSDLKLTYDDYVLFPDDGRRRELIDGEVHVSPSPKTRHQQIVVSIVVAIKNHLDKHGGGRVFVAPYDVIFSDFDVVVPDVVFVSDKDAGVITEANIKGAPTLIVEVLSDSRRDRLLKRDQYAQFGVSEYWVVDPDADRVEVYLLTSKGYAAPKILESGDKLTTKAIPGLTLDLAGLFRR
jgi:Uma2 family endonuclease